MTIEEIYYSEDLSARSFNVCNDNDLKSLSAILKHYHENKTFDNLRNCGRKSNEELIELCLKHAKNELNDFFNPENELASLISNFTRTQREIINSFIEINSNNLSNRSSNAINSFLNGNLKIRNISEKILTNDRFNFQDIKNVGTKTVTELKNFIDSIIGFIEKVSNVENENDLIVLRNRFFIEKTFSISTIPSEILESQSVFKLVDFLIKKDAIFEKKQNIIFQKAFKIYCIQPELTLDEIAEEFKISRERVRQLRKNCLEDLFYNLEFIKYIDDDLYQKYGIDQNQHLINIDDDLNDLINGVNKTNFSNEFNTFILYSYISEKFDLVGNIEDVLLPKYYNSRDRHNWINFYLVKLNLSSQFDFNNFANDVYKRLNTRIEETYSFHFKSYLNNFIKIEDSSLVSLLFPVAEKIINQEFDLIIDLHDNIVFKRNTLKQVHEYAVEALEELGISSKIEDIYCQIEKQYPDITKSPEALRGSLQRTPEIIYFGRSSTYGLKKWEIEKEGIKGGTIRDIVEDFLNDSNDPRHISEITDHVLEFRPKSNQNSIWTNIKLEESGIYTFFKGSKVGVSYKNYDVSFIQILEFDRIEKKTWEERYQMILNFTKNEKRLPYSSGCPENEKKLYRWFNIQISKCNQGKLDPEKEILIKEIESKYQLSQVKNRKSNQKSNQKYEHLMDFVRKNFRLPSANKTGEENLYHFFYKQRKFFEQGELDQYEENKFIEIAKIIQNHKYENKRN